MFAPAMLFPASEAGAGAWTLRAGEGQVIFQVIAAQADEEFGPSSRLYDSRPYDKLEATLVFEYGATDWLTLIVAPQILVIDLGPPDASSYSGPGYADLGARLRLLEGDGHVLSAQFVGRLPGAGNSDAAAAVGYEDGEIDLRLLYGVAFTVWDRPAFLDLQVAQRFRFGDPPDEFRLDLTLGVRVAERWQLLLQSFGVVSEGAGEVPYFAVSYEYLKIQAGAAYDVREDLTLQVAFVSTCFARNAPQENGLVLSGLYRF